MGRTLVAAALFVALFAMAFAGTARAEDCTSDSMKDMIHKEIESYFKDQKTDFRVYWKSGLNLKSGDGNFSMKIGGRIMADFTFFDDIDKQAEFAAGGEWHSGFEFRRARLYMSGTIYKYVNFKAQYDFATGDADFKDVWVGLTNLGDCLGCMFPDIKVGHFKEYFSLEELTSSKYTTFMERSLPVSTFAPSRNTGLGLFRDFLGERMTLGVGVFGNADDYGDGTWTEGGYHIPIRWTWLPWAPCNCESRFLHVGLAADYQGDVRSVRYRVRPETHAGPRIVDTGTFAADNVLLLGGELLFQYDQWRVQGEYISAIIDAPVAGDPTFWGYYVEGGWMFAGGTRGYKRAYGVVNRTKPCVNFLANDCCGKGGWELAARYSYVTTDDGNINGGTAANVTVGVNWYLNPNTLVKFNYTYIDAQDIAWQRRRTAAPVDSTASVFGMRFQVDF